MQVRPLEAGAPPVIVPRETPPTGAPRLPALDALRLFGALGVIWLHTVKSPVLAPAEVLGRFGVPLFAAAAAFFCVDSALRKPRPWRAYVRSRAVRLLVPFAAWTLIYLALRAGLKPLLTAGASNVHLDWSALYTGTAAHLWFLPFIFLAAVALDALVRATRARRSPSIRAALATALAVAGVALALTPTNWLGLASGGDRLTLDRLFMPMLGIDCAGALLLGAALALVLNGRTLGSIVRFAWRPLGCACLGAAAALMALEWAYGAALGPLDARLPDWLLVPGRTNWPENFAGFALLVCGLLPWYEEVWRRLAAIGSAALGMYLVHIVLVDAMQGTLPAVLRRVAPSLDASGTPGWDLLAFAVAALGSYALARLLTASARTRWLVT